MRAQAAEQKKSTMIKFVSFFTNVFFLVFIRKLIRHCKRRTEIYLHPPKNEEKEKEKKLFEK